MKRYLYVAFYIFVCQFGVVYAKPIDNYGQLSVKGSNIVDHNGDKVALKGISLGWHNWYSQYYNSSIIDYISRSWNISVVRAAMGVEPAGGYLENPEKSKAYIKTIIDAAISNGIYVIVDWHSHGIFTDQAIHFFSDLAQQYANYPNIIYEIFNEPEDVAWAEIKSYSITVIEAIRKYDENNLIIVGTPNWSHDVDTVADNPIEGYKNITYALHFYAASHNYLRSKVEYAIRKGLPIFVSKCSPSEASGNGKLDRKRFSKWMEFLKQNNISFILWGLYDKEESSAMLKSGADFDGNWSRSQLTEWGVYSRQIMTGKSSFPGIELILGVLLLSAIVYFIVRKIKLYYTRS